MLKSIVMMLMLFTYMEAKTFAAAESKGQIEDVSLFNPLPVSQMRASTVPQDMQIEATDFIEIPKVQEILSSRHYALLLAVDEDAKASEKQFNRFIEKYKGTVTGDVFTKTMKEILSHIRDKSPSQAYYMVCLADTYRSGELQDDDNQSAESKWLLAAAQQGYLPAISQIAELFTVGNFYFKKDQTTADTLYRLLTRDEPVGTAAIQTGTSVGLPFHVTAKEGKVHRTEKTVVKHSDHRISKARQQWIWQWIWHCQNAKPHLSLNPPLLQLGFIKLEEQSKEIYAIFFHGNKLLLAENTRGPSRLLSHEATPSEEQTNWTSGGMKKRKAEFTRILKVELFDEIHQTSKHIRTLEYAYEGLKILEKLILYAISIETRFLDELTQASRGSY